MILGLEPWIFWLIAAVVFAIIEAVTTNLVSIWFVVGCLAGMISYFCGAPVYLQIIIAFSVSAVTLILVLIFKPFDKFKRKKVTATNSDRVIGQTALVLTPIDAIEGSGTVKVMGQIWSAKSSDGSNIDKGENVVVIGISGVKLIVNKL